MTAPHPEEEDAHLMIALAGGNDPALNALMRRWSPRLSAYLHRCCPDPTTANDLLQETFVRVYQKRRSYDPMRPFSTWLYTIATNLVRNHARWQKRHPITLLDHDQLSQNSPPSEAPGPVESLEKQERGAAVRQAIASLPADLREPLILSLYEQMSHAQIASILDLSEKTVEMRLYRARQTLRESLRTWLPES
jgi:RNA polymerase sigma-70 factor, ECF subfamily